ncbi:MAG: type II toxin-antitoxin system VapC family toxin [Pseudonocardia sp.]
MIGYVDTSAFVPLLVDEPGTAACVEFWRTADAVVTTRLMYVEAAAALAQAVRAGRLGRGARRRALVKLDELWAEFDVIEVDEPLVRRAATLAEICGLRGYDAVHCAAAEQVGDADLVAATGDRRLVAAWQSLGVATFDPNPPS